MRLIDADALRKEHCKDCSADIQQSCKDDPVCATLMWVDEAPTIDAVPVVRWIPVTERMPELIPCNAGTAYSDAVIVWTDGRKAMIAVWDGVDFLCAADYWEAWGENITHWMPLPEPPKEGE